MKNLIVILTFFFSALIFHFASAQCCNPNNAYWEQLSDDVKKETITSLKVDANVVNYYKGELKFTDDEKSSRLLDTLTSESKNGNAKALYFYIFNDICAKSDGAISEILGKYCQKIMLNDPLYVLNYFSTHNSIMKTQAQLLGSELYFKEKGLSDIKYDFNSFKKLVNEKIKDDTILKETFNDYNIEIEKTMKNMD